MSNPVHALAVAVALSSFAAIAAASPKPIVIGALKGPSGIGMVRLFEQPLSLSDGSSPQLIAVSSADLMTAKLISGEYDVGVLPINVAAKLYNSGIPLKFAAIVGNGMVSLLGTDPTLASLADLKGKRISVAGQGATPDYLFRKLLKYSGLDPDKDVHLDYSLPYPEAAMALAAGRIPYAILPEPFATMARLRNPSVHPLLDLGALWTKATGQASYPMTAFVVSAKLASERSPDIKAILEAYSGSIKWVVANPREAGALVEKYELGLRADIAARAIPVSAYVFTEAAVARPSVEALLDVFLEVNPASIGGKLPSDGFYASF
jgi:NitT/TauT family transport system substrate-binding protein